MIDPFGGGSAGRDLPRDSDGSGFCVVGLGNPGEEYRSTRHNVGFQIVDAVAARWNVDIRRMEFRALTAEGNIGRSMVLLMKPQTFMNASGRAVADALSTLGLPPERVLAIYDDLDLPVGRLRVRSGGGTGGHRGVASMIEHLGTGDFPRLRVGIGRPPEGTAVIDYVLSPFGPEQAEEAAGMILRAADAVECILREGVTPAMQAFNGR
ncbi:MAG: aminoacyl-tRNA hydrolase [Candidatus Binatia bacterium]